MPPWGSRRTVSRKVVICDDKNDSVRQRGRRRTRVGSCSIQYLRNATKFDPQFGAGYREELDRRGAKLLLVIGVHGGREQVDTRDVVVVQIAHLVEALEGMRLLRFTMVLRDCVDDGIVTKKRVTNENRQLQVGGR